MGMGLGQDWRGAGVDASVAGVRSNNSGSDKSVCLLLLNDWGLGIG